MKTGIQLVSDERYRQISDEGWTREHDAQHADGQIAEAAACYLLHGAIDHPPFENTYRWPWSSKWWKPKSKIRNLVKAGALVAAEIDRLQAEGRVDAIQVSKHPCEVLLSNIKFLTDR